MPRCWPSVSSRRRSLGGSWRSSRRCSEGAEHGLLRQDAEHRHGGVALALAGQGHGRRRLRLGPHAVEVVHDHHVLLRGLAAQACIGAHALLGLFQLGGQADGRHHVQPLAVGVHHADAAARGAELRGDAMQEAAAHRVDIGRDVEERGDVVQRGQLAVLLGQLFGLPRHARGEIGVQPLQLFGHAVEAVRQQAELVVRLHRQARGELARRHALEPVLQAQHRQDDPQVQQIDHRQGAHAGHGGQRELRQPQQCGLVGVALLDHAHELVGLVDEARQMRQIGRRGPVRPDDVGGDAGLEAVPPGGADGVELAVDIGVGRQEQRPLGVALVQTVEGGVEPADLLVEQAGIAVARLQHGHADLAGAHAQAAGVVDGGAGAFKLPRQP